MPRQDTLDGLPTTICVQHCQQQQQHATTGRCSATMTPPDLCALDLCANAPPSPCSCVAGWHHWRHQVLLTHEPQQHVYVGQATRTLDTSVDHVMYIQPPPNNTQATTTHAEQGTSIGSNATGVGCLRYHSSWHAPSCCSCAACCCMHNSPRQTRHERRMCKHRGHDACPPGETQHQKCKNACSQNSHT